MDDKEIEERLKSVFLRRILERPEILDELRERLESDDVVEWNDFEVEPTEEGGK